MPCFDPSTNEGQQAVTTVQPSRDAEVAQLTGLPFRRVTARPSAASSREAKETILIPLYKGLQATSPAT